MRRIVAVLGIPALLGGLLLAGSSSFSATAKAAKAHTVKTAISLNLPSDRIDFSAIMTVNGGAFTLTSTGCNLTDEAMTALVIGNTCKVTAAGTIKALTGSTSGTVAITGADGAIVFKETTFRGCGGSIGAGSGFETDPGPRLVPVRVESRTYSTPTPSPTVFLVCGTIEVYEAGGTVAGIGCD